MTASIDVIPVEAGEVRGKRGQLDGRGRVGVRHLRTMLGRRWADPRPVYAWVVDHPAGAILVDTGPLVDPDRPREWRTHRWHPHYLLAYRSRAGRAGSLPAAIEAAGLDVADLETVVLTHGHPDHVGGLRDLDVETVRINRRELDFASSLRGRVGGFNPDLWPDDTPFEPVDLGASELPAIERSVDLSTHPGVHLIGTPGHTHHHCSVLVERAGTDVLIAGDVAYDLERLRDRTIDGVAMRPHAAQRSRDAVDRLAADRPLIVLPSHDVEAPVRLAEERPYEPPG